MIKERNELVKLIDNENVDLTKVEECIFGKEVNVLESRKLTRRERGEGNEEVQRTFVG